MRYLPAASVDGSLTVLRLLFLIIRVTAQLLVAVDQASSATLTQTSPSPFDSYLQRAEDKCQLPVTDESWR
jgi:hypothetical protein